MTQPIAVPDSGRIQRLRVSAGACSVQGPRRDTNEDQQYVSPDGDLFIVADGIGGHAAGEVASQFAVDALSHDLAKFTPDATPDEIEERVHAALNRAHCLILDSSEAQPEYRGAGTTVVMALLLGHRLYVTGVGDSRAYLVRGDSIERLTVDDTFPDTLLHMGQITVDQARRHGMRDMLLSALGVRDFKPNQEQIRVLEVYHADRFLLASDGLTDKVEQDRLLQIVGENDNPQQAAEQLTQEAIANNAGDDVTCVVFHVSGDLSKTASAPLATATPPTIWQRLGSLLRRGKSGPA